MASDQLDDLFALHRTEIVRLKADLAEARAQIKEQAKDAYFTQQQLAEARAKLEDIANYGEIIEGAAKALGPRMEELEKARAQIAAKDAALTHIVNECSRFPIKDGLAFRVESIALNGLETE